jgi:hypothetical protein
MIWATLLGALAPTFLLSRLFLWLLKRWSGGVLRIAAANALSFAACWILAGFGFGLSSGALWSASAGWLYVAPQLVWLAVDFIRYWRRPTSNSNGDTTRLGPRLRRGQPRP